MQDQSHKVAIITTVYDRIGMLERAIRSVDNQTFKDWIHFIVNDANPDTAKFLKKFEAQDKACKEGKRVIINLTERQNDYGYAGINVALGSTEAPYYCILADDNYFLPHHLEVLYEHLNRNSDLLDFVWGSTILKHRNIPEYFYIRDKNVPEWNQIDLGEPLYKRELWLKHGPYKYEDRPDIGDVKMGRPGCAYSTDWHFIHDCLKDGARWFHLKMKPSLIWNLADKHLTPDKFKHTSLLVTAFPAGNGGCAYYRLKHPLDMAHRNADIDVQYYDAMHDWRKTEILMQNSDVLIYQGVASNEIANQIMELRKRGKICICDVDDNIFGVEWDNPRYIDLGVKDVAFDFKSKDLAIKQMQVFREGLVAQGLEYGYIDSQITKIESGEPTDKYRLIAYQNGINGFSCERNAHTLLQAQNCLRAADAVTTTMPLLADKLKLFNENVKIFPNSINLDIWRNDLKYIRTDDQIRLIWQGGNSHFKDIYLVRDALVAVLKAHPEAILVIMGFLPEALKNAVPPEQIEVTPWSDYLLYPYKFHRLYGDIGIIPLRRSEFADAKSPIKWVEMGALEIPCVVSDTPVYNTTVKHGEDGFLFKDDKELAFYLELLIKNVDLRKQIGEKARAHVCAEFDLSKNYKGYIEWLEKMWLIRNWKISSQNTLYAPLLQRWEQRLGRRISNPKRQLPI